MDNLPIPWLIKMDDRLANGRGMTNCELVGISGGCGLDCPVLLAGECEVEDEMLSGDGATEKKIKAYLAGECETGENKKL